MEVYCEQSLNNQNIDKHKKRTLVLKITRYILVAIAIVIGYLFIFTPGDKGWGVILMNVIFTILCMIPFVLAFIFIGKFIKKSNIEYDYLINGNIFRIVSVVNRLKRKKLLETSISNFETIGRITNESYERFANDKSIKKIYAITDFEDESEVCYIYYTADGVKYLLHITPNEEMTVALRRSVGRISVFDKNFSLSVNKE